MEWSGVLNWRDSEGGCGTCGRFSKIEAPDRVTAERIVLDEYWDHRLDSAGCAPEIVFKEHDPDDPGHDPGDPE